MEKKKVQELDFLLPRSYLNYLNVRACIKHTILVRKHLNILKQCFPNQVQWNLSVLCDEIWGCVREVLMRWLSNDCFYKNAKKKASEINLLHLSFYHWNVQHV